MSRVPPARDDGVAGGAHRDVHPLAGPGEGRQFGGDHHRGDVLDVTPVVVI